MLAKFLFRSFKINTKSMYYNAILQMILGKIDWKCRIIEINFSFQIGGLKSRKKYFLYKNAFKSSSSIDINSFVVDLSSTLFQKRDSLPKIFLLAFKYLFGVKLFNMYFYPFPHVFDKLPIEVNTTSGLDYKGNLEGQSLNTKVQAIY